MSYSDQVKPRLVVAVLLRGRNHVVNGGSAADVAGRVFSRLRAQNYFAQSAGSTTVASVLSH
jgi:hypothetical protein